MKNKIVETADRVRTDEGSEREKELVAIKLVGKLGRVVIPAEMRKLLGLNPGVEVGLYAHAGRLVLEAWKDDETCFVCGRPDGVRIESVGRRLCRECVEKIAKTKLRHRRPSDD